MPMSKLRIGLFGLLLVTYLAGVLLLSAVTFHEPKNNAYDSKVTDRGHQVARSRSSLEYGFPGLRAPFRRTRIQWCSELKYLNPAQESVALASFPGSGNTWLRYLLQQATGLYTGSVYKDYGLLKNGFPAESVVNGSVLVVKTHEWGAVARRQFQKAILLVRAPGPAIQAEFNRQSGGHVGFASPERYRRNRGRQWRQFVDDKLRAWKQTNLDWLRNFTGPTHVIFYEQLVANVRNTLRTVIEFLEVPVSDELFRCALERQEGIYRRKRRVLAFDPFTDAMKENIRREQERVYEEIYNVALPADRKR